VQLFRQLKRTFDPTNIFNPGVKHEGRGDPIADLKVGVGRAVVDPGIERGLRWIEASGGYAGSRLTLADSIPPGP